MAKEFNTFEEAYAQKDGSYTLLNAKDQQKVLTVMREYIHMGLDLETSFGKAYSDVAF